MTNTYVFAARACDAKEKGVIIERSWYYTKTSNAKSHPRLFAADRCIMMNGTRTFWRPSHGIGIMSIFDSFLLLTKQIPLMAPTRRSVFAELGC